MKTVIIDYGSGNLQSVFNALLSLNLGHEIIISDRPEILKTATHLVLPGVGAFADCMQGLKAIEGLGEALHKQVMIEKKPLLGICVGMQVLASKGYENGETLGLGFIDGKVVKIDAAPDLRAIKIESEEVDSQLQTNDSFAEKGSTLKIPHMGWNELILKPEQISHPILKGVKNGDHVYFAHSYHFLCQNEGNVLAQVEYGAKLNAVIAKKNIVGIQFHPEKSGEVGLQILKNFLNWRF